MLGDNAADDLINSDVFKGGFSDFNNQGFQNVSISSDPTTANADVNVNTDADADDADDDDDAGAHAYSVGVNDNPPSAPVFEANRSIAEDTMNSSNSSTTGRERANKDDQQYLRINIVEIEAENSKDPVIKMNIRANIHGYRSKIYKNVRRTHGEIVKLARYFMSTHPECLIPAVPEVFTSAGSGSKDDMQYMISGLQSWLNYVAMNPNLLHDPELKLFVESDYGYSPLINTGNPTSGLKRKALKQLPLPPDPCEELATLRPVVKSFYRNTKDTETKLQKLVARKQALAQSHIDLGQSMIDYASVEDHTGLANAINRLGKMLQTLSDVRLMQSATQLVTFADTLSYASNNAFVAKEILSNRHILMRDLITTQHQTNSCLSSANRLQSNPKISKARTDEALEALEVSRLNEKALSQKLTYVTLNLLNESKTYKKQTSLTLQGSIRNFVEKEACYERRILATLESMRPYIRNIDSMGGLSRLGREGFPRRLSNPPPSQKLNQDAWNNRKRSAFSHKSDVSSQAGIGSSNVSESTNATNDGDNLTERHRGADKLDPKSVASLLNAI
ncbi:retromer complex subunit Vps17 [Schizosaccharomyces cryophilus OY26]|uniref:Vacuolar protein sorting-associated protein 17 n=1 Tax=Schizosaccharomyces cryophilus (strain OY26 / ATCC MYA-4695 / CBS 11777 / NBRC 106824 / NRRL Y48691) TaxID=653667 RepID=S9W6A5_SCHCR|nr:retromer complex subunit Vps17 [Schizosaccharomyces cryophilus OY26]EPY54094.1 retromer complex subunit Vps17 [Schizosaccharomyces cryophilus OY26]